MFGILKLYRFSNSTGILGPGDPGTIPNALGIWKPVFDIVYRILGGRTRVITLDVDFATHLDVPSRPTTTDATGKYALLGYIFEIGRGTFLQRTTGRHENHRIYDLATCDREDPAFELCP